MHKTLNPAELKPAELHKLVNFLNKNPQQCVWKKNTVYRINNRSSFELTHDIVRRERTKYRPGNRYEVLSDVCLAAGAVGAIFLIKGTIAFDNGVVEFKERPEGRKRIVKIEKHLSVLETVNASNESDLSQLAKHLHAKHVTISGRTSYLVMRKIRGTCLSELFFHDYNGSAALSLDVRFALSEAILRALKMQITDCGIVHNDIKPDNIIVNLECRPFEVNIIDLGEGKRTGDDNKETLGTISYRAPEITTTSASDLYSIARTLCQLWGAGCYSSIENEHDVNCTTLFQGIVDLQDDEQTRNSLRNLLIAMLNPNPAERINITEALAGFILVRETYANNLKTQHNNQTELAHNGLNIETIEQGFGKVKRQLNLLETKATDLSIRGYGPLAERLQFVCNTLQKTTDTLREKGEQATSNEFHRYKKFCDFQIARVKDELAQHRTINTVLINLGLAVVGLGAFYMAIALYKYCKSGEFGFFTKTKSLRLIENFEKKLDFLSEAESINDENNPSLIVTIHPN